MFTYFNLLRGYVSREDHITALAIIKEIRTKIIEYNITPDANRLFSLMGEVAYELGLESPFEDMRTLDNVYHSLNNIDELSWEEIVSSYNPVRKTMIPEPIVEEMLTKLTSQK